MNIHSGRILEQNNFLKLKVFSLDEEIGQLSCKNVQKVFESIISQNCPLKR